MTHPDPHLPPRETKRGRGRLFFMILGATLASIVFYFAYFKDELLVGKTRLVGNLRCLTIERGFPGFREKWVVVPRKADGRLHLVKLSIAPENHLTDPDSSTVLVFHEGITEELVHDLASDLLVGDDKHGGRVVFWQKPDEALERYEVRKDPEEKLVLRFIP